MILNSPILSTQKNQYASYETVKLRDQNFNVLRCKTTGNLSQIPEIAASYKLSEAFLFKILRPLVEHDFVLSIRGRNGGIKLARPASQMTLKDVIRVTEDNFAMADCFDNAGTNCPLVNQCGLNIALNEALDAFFAVLDKYSIEELISHKSGIEELLGLHLLGDVQHPVATGN